MRFPPVTGNTVHLMDVGSVNILMRVDVPSISLTKAKAHRTVASNGAAAKTVADNPFVFAAIATLVLVVRDQRQMLAGLLVHICKHSLKVIKLYVLNTVGDIVAFAGVRVVGVRVFRFFPHRTTVVRVKRGQWGAGLCRIAPQGMIKLIFMDGVEQISPKTDAASVVVDDVGRVHLFGMNTNRGNGTRKGLCSKIDHRSVTEA